MCRPLAPDSIRKIHFCLSGALARAVRWRWISVNPLDAAESPRGRSTTRTPHRPRKAAAIVTAAFAMGLWWGAGVWLAMTNTATIMPDRRLSLASSVCMVLAPHRSPVLVLAAAGVAFGARRAWIG
jgi:hypothetical protein